MRWILGVFGFFAGALVRDGATEAETYQHVRWGWGHDPVLLGDE